MRRFFTYAIALTVAMVGTVALAQQVSTPEGLDAAMKKIGPAMGATNKAVKSMAYGDAKAQVMVVKQALMDAENFWAANKKDDAVQMSKESIARVTAVEEALSASSPDMETVMAALKQVGGTCGACHKMYRVQDETTKEYSLKPGTI
jgi:cytochrome c556